MKNAIQTSAQKINSILNLKNVALSKDQLQALKGGDTIITTDIVDV